MLNSEEPTGAGNEIIQIEDLAIHGGDLLEQKDYEGAFIAWLGVHQLAERIFGSDDPVSVDALRLAISSLDHIDRFNQADRLLKVVLGSNDDSDPIRGNSLAAGASWGNGTRRALHVPAQAAAVVVAMADAQLFSPWFETGAA